MKKFLIVLCISFLTTMALFANGNVEVKQESDITLEVWTPVGSNAMWMQSLIEAYKLKEPNVIINHTTQNFGDFFTVLNTAIASGNVPDVTWSNTVAYKRYVEADAFMDLNDYYKQYGWRDAVGGDTIDLTNIDGISYVLPMDKVYQPLFYYNKVIFKNLGLTAPQNDADFAEVCRKLEDAGYLSVVMGNKDVYPGGGPLDYWVATRVTEKAYNQYFDDFTKVDFTDKEHLEILDTYKFYVDNIWTDGVNAMSVADCENLFAGYKAGIMQKDSYLLAKTRISSQFNDPANEIGVFFMPAVNEGDTRKISFMPNGMYTITKDCEVADEAAKFLDFMISSEGQSMGAENGVMPIRKDIIVPEAGGPVLKEAFEKMKGSELILTPFIFISNEFKSRINYVIQDMVGGKYTPQEAAEALNACR